MLGGETIACSGVAAFREHKGLVEREEKWGDCRQPFKLAQGLCGLDSHCLKDKCQVFL